MATPDTYSERPRPRAQAATFATPEQTYGIVGRWRNRRAERKLARLLSARNRRALAERLRRTARDANDRNRKRGGLDVLLRYRAAAVRTELLEIAALLEQAPDPDPSCVEEIHQLLANGDSPLYHPGVHVSELYTTLHYVHAGLASNLPPGPAVLRGNSAG